MEIKELKDEFNVLHNKILENLVKQGQYHHEEFSRKGIAKGCIVEFTVNRIDDIGTIKRISMPGYAIPGYIEIQTNERRVVLYDSDWSTLKVIKKAKSKKVCKQM